MQEEKKEIENKIDIDDMPFGGGTYFTKEDDSEFIELKFKYLVEQLHGLEKPEELSIFTEFASFLMEEVCIVAGDNLYRIMECEFYYHSINHPDPYVHAIDKKYNKYAKEKQCKSGDWYFHDAGTGLDIAIGNTNDKIYGGILIRGIYKLETDEDDPCYVGPIIVCEELFNNIGSIFNSNLSLKFLDEKINDCKIENFPRWGLKLYKKENEEDNHDVQSLYREKPYRFIVVSPSQYINHKKFLPKGLKLK